MMVVNGLYGMGDNIYQRAFIREIKERVYLRTSWPQLYADLPNVCPVKPKTKLRTQNKNVARQPQSTWHTAPSLPAKKISYNGKALKKGSILTAMSKCLGGIAPRVFDMPAFTGPEIQSYAVIRPVTVRGEWANTARNPKAEYISEAARILKEHGLYTVSVADLQSNAEWAEAVPECDIAFNHGELPFEQLMGLIQGASIVVGGVGWIVPTAIAAGVPLITVLGGLGAHNAPEKITAPPMDLSKTRWIYPDNYCRCSDMLHQCEKDISDFDFKFREALSALCSAQLQKTV